VQLSVSAAVKATRTCKTKLQHDCNKTFFFYRGCCTAIRSNSRKSSESLYKLKDVENMQTMTYPVGNMVHVPRRIDGDSHHSTLVLSKN